LHFHSHDNAGSRLFSVVLENEVDKAILNLDVFLAAGGKNAAVTKTVTGVPVTDGFLTIVLTSSMDQPKVNAIEIIQVGVHASHAVLGGPYAAVDIDGDGFQSVPVNAIQSHTHGLTNGVPNSLRSYTWRKGNTVIGTGEKTNLVLPVGDNLVSLTVVDSSGSPDTGETVIKVTGATSPRPTVLSYSLSLIMSFLQLHHILRGKQVEAVGFPTLDSLSPQTGSASGGTTVTITGQQIGTATAVRFGPVLLTSGNFTVVNSGTIEVITPGPEIGVPVKVSVITSRGESNALKFTYVRFMPIAFSETLLSKISSPTAVVFGPDGKLYVGSQSGALFRLTLNEAYDQVINVFPANFTATPNRCILGIAFNPLETPETGADINVYISTSRINHPGTQNSAGDSINGKVQRVWGANLENIADVITGLPVSKIDHAVSVFWFKHYGDCALSYAYLT
jgi:IPT/TIG domain/Malectin domain